MAQTAAQKAANARYREKNRERRNAQTRAWRKDNKDRVLAYRRARYASDAEHRAQVLESNHRVYEENKERHLANSRAWVAAHPEAMLEIKRRYRARRRDAVAEHITADQICALWLGVCTYCLRSMYRDEAHLDHWIPLAKGGAHAIGNLSFMHASCNQRKHTAIMPVPLRMRQLEILQMVGEF